MISDRVDMTLSDEAGFTLIEMMIGMAMGLIILAGLTMMFVSMNDASRAVTSRGERMADLYLVSHLMQAELRGGQDICWDGTNNQIIYQPLDSVVALGTCDTVDATNGAFRMNAANVGGGKPTPYICWDQPNIAGGCQELIRDMSATGLTASSATGIWVVTLVAEYLNENKQTRELSLQFNTWPRN
ncbi:prepilin-type N-terminal cleavage/methylation domain-containing protein [Mariprofundus sp. NF]|uniref:PilW family protein n=1 Tax=Mariprofundus sp. NF TaxID=2608716 RepID=UPI0015A1DEFA|nr:prepilin-type N-terminal cleavage/methylation domain-containing protein [Mariprofundus sp. NF]NWF38153.1 prepilin-type N-terminal cleavage/methylation domain-containing protein [Mariprofundus sp. NF]